MKPSWLSLPSRPELGMTVLLVGIVTVLVVPLNRFMLDVLTVISMASCLLVLLMAVRVQSPVELLTFPALLLITTMLRLALNVASTKMILLEGKAGHVVETFGRVVMGENLLVGLCVFAIVSVVQFLVVAKGADRVAEVAARFSLDAMPGKQMSIDAEMRAGSLSAEAASRRRDRLDIESRFFGGMDGAMKFVKGDAVAGLVITIVNILGGVASGMAYHGMPASVALARYSTLSVGDAMVAQIPSFMLAVAAGLVTTRVTSSQGVQNDLGRQILAEIMRHPTALLYVGLFCASIGLMPGFPTLIFLVLGCGLMACGLLIQRSEAASQVRPTGWQRPMESFKGPGATVAPAFIESSSQVFDAPLVLQLPAEWLDRVDAALLDEQLLQARARLVQRWGSPFPGLRCCVLEPDPAAQQPPVLRWVLNGNHQIDVPWQPSARLMLGERAPLDDGEARVPGFPDARWLAEGEGPAGAAEAGVRLETLLAWVTENLCIREQGRLLTHEQFREILQDLRTTHPQLSEGLAAVVPLPVLTDTVRALLREGFSLRSLPQMCDMMVSFAPLPQDANSIADQIVTGWSRRRCADAAIDGVIKVHLVDPLVETVLQQYAAAASQSGASPAAMDLDAFREVRVLLGEVARQHPRGMLNLVCRGQARVLVSEIASMVNSRFRVFSFRGINPRFNIEILSRIELSAEARDRMLAALGDNPQEMQPPVSDNEPFGDGGGFDDFDDNGLDPSGAMQGGHHNGSRANLLQ